MSDFQNGADPPSSPTSAFALCATADKMADKGAPRASRRKNRRKVAGMGLVESLNAALRLLTSLGAGGFFYCVERVACSGMGPEGVRWLASARLRSDQLAYARLAVAGRGAQKGENRGLRMAKKKLRTPLASGIGIQSGRIWGLAASAGSPLLGLARLRSPFCGEFFYSGWSAVRLACSVPRPAGQELRIADP